MKSQKTKKRGERGEKKREEGAGCGAAPRKVQEEKS